jgi:hypothetical protein
MTELTKVENVIKVWTGVQPYLYLNIFEFADRFLENGDGFFIDLGDEFGKQVPVTDISLDGVPVLSIADFKTKLSDFTKIETI